MSKIVTADIGGTHARFALAELSGGRVTALSSAVTLKTANFESFEGAWREFASRNGGELPSGLAIAFAGPVDGDVLKLTNSAWRIRREELHDLLGLERLTVVNDFGAVAHAVAQRDQSHFLHVCGPDRPLPESGVITIVGPGTGLGVAALIRKGRSSYDVIETEAGHVDFAPLDALEDRMLHELRARFGRVSIERLVSGPGLSNIYEVLGTVEGPPLPIRGGKALWSAAIEGSDALAAEALERFCLTLGSACGDFALAHGSFGVVLGGGVGMRLNQYLPGSGFGDRFIAKGRFERRMAQIPVKLLTGEDAGLFGAAVAFARDQAAGEDAGDTFHSQAHG